MGPRLREDDVGGVELKKRGYVGGAGKRRLDLNC